MIAGEDNYAPVGRVVILPFMGWVLLYSYGETTTKEIKRIYPQKRGSHLRLNFSCMGLIQTDLSCRWKKRGSEKVDEEDDEIKKKIILSSCQGGHILNHTKKRFAFAIKLFLQK